MDVSKVNQMGFSHAYEIYTRDKGFSVGLFSPDEFLSRLNGTGLVTASGGRSRIFLTSRGKDFADWLISNERDAETFQSDKGRWGKEQTMKGFMEERYKGFVERGEKSDTA